MAIIDFPERPRANRGARPPRPYDLARQMIRARERQKALAAERRRLLESLGRLERLAREVESIQADLERLRATLAPGRTGE